MAQVLKEEIRNRIVEASINEFYEYGFKGSSLRKISKISGITPGNLYRYFENKETLYEHVVGEAYRKLNFILMKNSDNKLNIGDALAVEDFNALRQAEQGKVMNKVIYEVLDAFGKNLKILLILLKDDRADFVMNTRFGLLDWLKNQFEVLYKSETLADDLAYSFAEGLIKIFMDNSAHLDIHLKERTESFVQFFYMRGLHNE